MKRMIFASLFSGLTMLMILGCGGDTNTTPTKTTSGGSNSSGSLSAVQPSICPSQPQDCDGACPPAIPSEITNCI